MIISHLSSLNTWVVHLFQRQSDTNPLSEQEDIDFRGVVNQIGNIEKMMLQAFSFRNITENSRQQGSLINIQETYAK